jgi:hypothetical protein
MWKRDAACVWEVFLACIFAFEVGYVTSYVEVGGKIFSHSKLTEKKSSFNHSDHN